MVTRPDVSDDAVVDFDHHSDAFNRNLRTINAELRQKCPVAWNENYDGFWFLTNYDAGDPNRPRRRHLLPQIRAERRRRRRLPGRDGYPKTRRPTGPGHRRGRRPLPPGTTARAVPV